MGFLTSALKSNPFIKDLNDEENNKRWHLTDEGQVVSSEIYEEYKITKKNLHDQW